MFFCSAFLKKTARSLAVLSAGMCLTLSLLSTVSDAQGPKVSEQSVDLLTRTGKAMAEVTAAVKPGIVNILTTRTVKVGTGQDPFLDDPFFKRFFGDQFGRQKQHPKEQKSSGLGSGVIVSSEGYIITNSHVVKDADEIKVTLTDKREFVGKIIGSDLKTEIAVVKIDAQGLPTVPWGNSEKLQVGDADLQNDPADIPRLLAELERGFDAVSGVRVERDDSWVRRASSRIANAVRNWATDERITDVGCSLKVYRREFLEHLPMFTGMHRFLPMLVRWNGARVGELPVRHRPRLHGVAKYGIGNRLFRALADLYAVRWMRTRWIDPANVEELAPGAEPRR